MGSKAPTAHYSQGIADLTDDVCPGMVDMIWFQAGLATALNRPDLVKRLCVSSYQDTGMHIIRICVCPAGPPIHILLQVFMDLFLIATQGGSTPLWMITST